MLCSATRHDLNKYLTSYVASHARIQWSFFLIAFFSATSSALAQLYNSLMTQMTLAVISLPPSNRYSPNAYSVVYWRVKPTFNPDAHSLWFIEDITNPLSAALLLVIVISILDVYDGTSSFRRVRGEPLSLNSSSSLFISISPTSGPNRSM